jgi:hypothetical protein
MILTALAGLLLGAVVSGAAFRIWGLQAAIAAGIFAAIAVVIQLVALVLMQPVRGAPYTRFLKRWGVGMGLRFLGIVAIAVAAGLDRTHFPPIPTAAGFLGVLLPLLFFEVRLIR